MISSPLRFKTVHTAAPSAPTSPSVVMRGQRTARLVRRAEAPRDLRSLDVSPVPPPAPTLTLRASDRQTDLRLAALAARGSPLAFRTVGEIVAQPPSAPAPFITSRSPLDQETTMRAARRQPPPPRAVRYVPGVTPYGASSVGITASGGTTITMVPADLTVSGRTDITQFVAVSLDAGVY